MVSVRLEAISTVLLPAVASTTSLALGMVTASEPTVTPSSELVKRSEPPPASVIVSVSCPTLSWTMPLVVSLFQQMSWTVSQVGLTSVKRLKCPTSATMRWLAQSTCEGTTLQVPVDVS